MVGACWLLPEFERKKRWEASNGQKSNSPDRPIAGLFGATVALRVSRFPHLPFELRYGLSLLHSCGFHFVVDGVVSREERNGCECIIRKT